MDSDLQTDTLALTSTATSPVLPGSASDSEGEEMKAENDKTALVPKTGDAPTTKAYSTRDAAAFFICGVLNNFGYVVMNSAAPDLLAGDGDTPHIPAGAVLMVNVIPTLVLKFFAPFFMHRISYSARVIIVVCMAMLGFGISALVTSPWLRLVGVFWSGLSSGAGEITFLAMCTYFSPESVSMWSSGTGGAGVAGSFAYLFLRSILGMSVSGSMWAVFVLPLIQAAAFFFLMDRPHSMDNAHLRGASSGPKELASSDLEAVEAEFDSEDDNEEHDIGSHAPAKKKLEFVKAHLLIPFMLPLFAVYFAEYVATSGVAATITYSGSGVPAGSQYMWFQFIYQVGVFISRSSVKFVHIHKIWVPSLLQCVNLAILFWHAWAHVIPSLYIVFGIIFWAGLLGGSTYVNAFYNIRHELHPAGWREFALGAASVADSCGIALAGAVSVVVEEAIRNHHGGLVATVG